MEIENLRGTIFDAFNVLAKQLYIPSPHSKTISLLYIFKFSLPYESPMSITSVVESSLAVCEPQSATPVPPLNQI